MNNEYDTERVMRAFRGEAFKEKYKDMPKSYNTERVIRAFRGEALKENKRPLINSYTNLNKVSKEDNEIKMSEIAKLRDNWNGYNAKAISKEVIEKTNKILCDIRVQPKIFPTPNNSIQFEFYDRNNLSKYLEFDISYDEISCNGEKISPEEINQKIMAFYGIN